MKNSFPTFYLYLQIASSTMIPVIMYTSKLIIIWID